jgi:hypothetical protein
MYRIRNFLLLGALLLVLGTSTQASADFKLYAQQDGVNGGAVTEIGSGADFTSTAFSGSYGDFSLALFGATSSNGAAFSDLLTAVVRITNNSADTETLTLYASQTNYSLPATDPLIVTSGLAGTVANGDLSGGGVFQAYADSDNNILGVLDFTNGPQNAVFNGNTFDTGPASGLFDRDGLYSLTSVVEATISAGGQGNFSTNIVVTPIPEPASLLLLGTGLTFVASRVRNRMKARA